MRIVCFILAVTGAIVMLVTLFRYTRLVRAIDVEHDLVAPIKRLTFNINRLLLLFFVCCYIVGAVDVLMRDVEPIFYFIIIAFALGGLFVFALIEGLRSMSEILNEKNSALRSAVEEIASRNARLKDEIHERVRDVMHQDELLHIMNDMATRLFASDVDEFDEALYNCMGTLGRGLSAGGVFVWKVVHRDSRPFGRQIYCWPERDKIDRELEFTGEPDGLYEPLAAGYSVNRMAEQFTPVVRELLLEHHSNSMLLIPAVFDGALWGFVGFSNDTGCMFTSDQEATLRSGSLLLVNAILRNEANRNLVQAREEALAGTRAKSDFLANISHEIRTPINAITGMAAIAQSTGDMNRISDCLTKIDVATKQLLGLINDVLDMSKIEAGRFELAHEPFN